MPKYTMVYHLIAIVILTLLPNTLACNGYMLKLTTAKTCIDNSVIQLENPDATFDKDCNLILTGCVNVIKEFKTAKGKYSVKKAPMPELEGEIDFCNAVKKLNAQQVGKLAKMYGAPTACPVPAGKICANNTQKISLSKYKTHLGMAAGTTSIKLEVDHDSGKSCLEYNVNIVRNKRRNQ